MEIVLESLDSGSGMDDYRYKYTFGFYMIENGVEFIINTNKLLLFDHNRIIPFNEFIKMYEEAVANER